MEELEEKYKIVESLVDKNIEKPVVKVKLENPIKLSIIQNSGTLVQAVIWSEIINRPVSMRKNHGRQGL